VEKEDGKLVLRIPLEDGGSEFLECSNGISEIEAGNLKIIIPEWLAAMFRIDEGSIVGVANASLKFNVRSLNPNPLQ
jgi:hypothetical protein